MIRHINPPMRLGAGLFIVLTALLSFVMVTPGSAAEQYTNDPFGAARLQRPGDVTIFQVSKATGVPRFVSGELSAPAQPANQVQTAIQFFKNNSSQFKMSDPASELVENRTDVDKFGNHHIRFNQVYQGLPVIGRQMLAHFNSAGVLKTVNGSFEPKIDLDVTNVRIRDDRATGIAQADLQSFFGKGTLKAQPELVIFPWEGTDYLAWQMFLMSSTPMGRWEYFIDARTGDVIYKANRIMNDAAANDIGTGLGVLGTARNHIDTDFNGSVYRMIDYTRQANNNPHGHDGQMPDGNYIQTDIASTSLPGSVATDADNYWDNATSQRPAVDGQVYSASVYDWWLQVFGRNSYNDSGASMLTSVNYSAEGDNNAYWNGEQIVIWSWSSPYRSLAGCPDVIAHEWGHAITERTSGLIYEKEPGALNESFSDMMGAAFEWAHDTLDTPDWLMGENGRTDGGAFRDMENPAVYDQPEYYGSSDPNWFDVTGCSPNIFNDNCGVHTNSGVGNKWFQLLSDGGTHHSVTVGGIGVANAIQIAYQANVYYWNASTNYHEAALATLSAANDLDGTGAWATQSALAWNAVGVSTPAPGIAFTYPGGTPNNVTPDQPTSFAVNVVSYLNGTPISGTGELHYRINGGAWQMVSMTEGQPNEYTATLPALACGETAEYYVSAESVEAGVQNDPDPSVPHSAFPSTGTATAFSDDFETDQGWTAQGQWARGNPTGGGGQHGYADPQDAHSGSNEFGYNLSGDYANNLSETHLTSPAIDCSSLSGVSLSFWRWLGVEQPQYDHAYVRVSTDGTSWTTIWENSQEIDDSSWSQQIFDISSIADGQSTVYIRFTMGSTDGSWQFCGWNVDDVEVSGFECSSGPTDSDGDGIADGIDNCPNDYNPSQTDADNDNFGAACDCNDNDSLINPNTVWYKDNDGDGYGGTAMTLTQCDQPAGYVLNSDDCNDADSTINPGTVWYADSDGDSFGDDGVTLTQCTQPTGYVSDDQDCNDADSTINPNTVWYEDADGDGYGNDSVTLAQCDQPTGYVEASGDCNDADSTISPATVWYEDSDGDGFGDDAVTLTQCDQPMGYVLVSGDCNDADSTINPNTVWYADADGDTYGDPNTTLAQCEQPTGYVANDLDCNDADSTDNPNTVWYQDADNDGFGNDSVTVTQCEQPAGFVGNSDDCNDSADSVTVAQQWFLDADNDGFGASDSSVIACTQPTGFVANGDDCNDADSTISPNTVWYADSDGDTFGDPNTTLTQCDQPDGYVLDDQDCNDGDNRIHPGTVWYIDVDGDGFGDTVATIVSCEGQQGFVLVAGDNCPANFNPGQEDDDSDGVGNICDNCSEVFNPGQQDSDSNGVGDACQSCCVGAMRGNIDGDPNDEVTLGDLSALIDHLFISLDPVQCVDEADVDGSNDGEITLSDLSALIDNLFISLDPLPPCP